MKVFFLIVWFLLFNPLLVLWLVTGLNHYYLNLSPEEWYYVPFVVTTGMAGLLSLLSSIVTFIAIIDEVG